MPKCRVYGCEQIAEKGIVTHRFPYKNNLELAQRWLILCKIEFGDLKKFNFKGLVICGKHFAEDAYEVDHMAKILGGPPKKNLKPDAVPTLSMPAKSKAKVPKRRQSSINRQQREERKRVLDEATKMAGGGDFKKNKPNEATVSRGNMGRDDFKKNKSTPKNLRRHSHREKASTSASSSKSHHRNSHSNEDNEEIPSVKSSASMSNKVTANTPATSHQPLSADDTITHEDQEIISNEQLEPPVIANFVTIGTPGTIHHQSQAEEPTIHDDQNIITSKQPVPPATTCFVNLAGPESFVACSTVTCACGSKNQFSKEMMSQGTQTEEVKVGDLKTVKSDHHYYFLTPKKETRPQGTPPSGNVETSQQQVTSQSQQDPQSERDSQQTQQMQPQHNPTKLQQQPQSNLQHQSQQQSSQKKLVYPECGKSLDSSSSDSSDSDSSDHSDDPDYKESDSGSSSPDSDSDDDDSAGNPITQMVSTPKFLVFEDQLRRLFTYCRCEECGIVLDLPSRKEPLGTVVGSCLTVKMTCINGHNFVWRSQPTIGTGSSQTPVGNLLIPAAVLFSGCNFTKIHHFADILHWEIVGSTTFYDYQHDYLWPTIHDRWADEQKHVLEQIRRNGGVRLSGDGRCDSPGYSAKFMTYSVMDMDTDKIVDVETVQVTEVTSSNAMEKEGCKRVLTRLQNTVKLDVLCTDRHMGIQKMMREDFNTISHQYDVWHLAKSVAKKLTQKAKKKEAEALMPWIPAIKTHLWWSAATCGGDAVEVQERWRSLSHHITNDHDWGYGQKFVKCDHGALEQPEEEETKWLEKGKKAHEALNEVLEDKLLSDGVRKLNLFCHTGHLENFNGFLTKYCPKRNGFKYEGMVARAEMAALDHNNNVGRDQARIKKPTSTSAAEGDLKYNMVFQKQNKKWVAKPVFEDKTYEFVDDMLEEVLRRKLCKNKESDNFRCPVLAKNIAPASIPVPTKEEAIAFHQSRFGH